jgi:threonine/homoserine/homoserine lactone efflux protein
MHIEQQAKQSNALSELPVRGFGLLGLICGAGIAYLAIVAPLLAAARHAQSVHITVKGAAITPLALAFGAVYTLLPNQASAILGHPQRPTKMGWVFATIFGLLGIPLYWWLKGKLIQSGYVF